MSSGVQSSTQRGQRVLRGRRAAHVYRQHHHLSKCNTWVHDLNIVNVLNGYVDKKLKLGYMFDGLINALWGWGKGKYSRHVV